MQVDEGTYDRSQFPSCVQCSVLHLAVHVSSRPITTDYSPKTTAHVVEAGAMECPSFFIRKSDTQVTNENWPANNVCDVRVSYRRKGDEKYVHFYDGFCNIVFVESYNTDTSSLSPVSLEDSSLKGAEIVIEEAYEEANLTPNSSEDSSLKDTGIEDLSIILTEANELTFATEDQLWTETRSTYLYNYLNITPCEPKIYKSIQQPDILLTQSCFGDDLYEYKRPDSERKDLDLLDDDILFDAVDFGDPKNIFGIDVEDEIYSDLNIEVFSGLNDEVSDPSDKVISDPNDEIVSDPNDEVVSEPNDEVVSDPNDEVVSDQNNEVTSVPKNVVPTKDNCALEQLMSSDMQSVSKQRKTILFSGQGTNPGQTIQNISYNDPSITCTEVDVGSEVIVESTSPEPTPKKKYQCDKCKHIFARISAFRQHMVKEHVVPENRATYRCADCGRTFKNEQKYEQHCSGHGDPDLECPKCHKVYASKFSLRAHLKIHQRKFGCSQCARTYARFSQYKTHMRKSHSMMLCKYDDCTFVAKKKSELASHHRRHSQLSQPQLLEPQLPEPELLEPVDYVNVWDDDIEAIFEVSEKTNATSDRIKEADSVIEKVMSNNVFSMKTDKNGKPSKCNKKCVVCGKKFDRSQDIKRHLIEHVIRSTLSKAPITPGGTLRFECEVCHNHTFTKIDQYKCHLREHARLTIYKCTLCDRTFSDSSNFSKHKKIHGYSHYECDVCYRKFNTKKMIVRHMELHAENQPMDCNICGKTFHFKSMMNKHMKSAHSSTKLSCKFCDEVFKSLKTKWDHQWLVHNLRKDIVDCPQCGEQFRKYTEMKRHAVNRHGLEPHTIKKLARSKM